MDINLESKFLGGMVGSALGDAIGEMAFRYRHEEVLLEAVEKADQLEYTDDSAMAIGIAESLDEIGEIETQHLGETFRRNYEREPWRGYASGPPTIFSKVRRGASYTDAAESLFGGSGSFGNGAAMRIAPVGLYFHDSADFYVQAEASARVTHCHPLGVDGAAVLAKAIAMAANLSPAHEFPLPDFCRELRAFVRTAEFQEKMHLVEEMAAGEMDIRDAAHRLGTNVTAHGSVPYAIFAFLRSPGSFEQCLLNAALVGGDRDTLGAMACGVSGAYLGIEAIPRQWRGKLENGAYIESLARRLAERKLKGEA